MLIPVESCLLLQNFVYECLYNPKFIVHIANIIAHSYLINLLQCILNVATKVNLQCRVYFRNSLDIHV